MADEDITRIQVQVQTVQETDAGTQGLVYLFIAGREFLLRTPSGGDHEPGSRTFVLGEGSNVLNSASNDPRDPQLRSSFLGQFPPYLRFGPVDENDVWHLERVDVTVTAGDGSTTGTYRYQALADEGPTKRTLRMGTRYSQRVYLDPVSP
ncbi:hypothetical protein [Streptomyces glaucescens]|uniref:hypothetical protein n=1 Tax=Streptomyces glaucescens TaxID=1907 RepID=UPI000A38E30C|nr:hypothetical protein [Streptomyces glaucescens]